MKQDRGWLLGTFLLACGVYLPSLRVGFFSDDFQWLGRMNATLEQPGYVFTVFFRDFNPVLHASFALDWIIAGYTPWWWHLHAVLLHGLGAALLFLLARRLDIPSLLAFGATLTWAWNVRISESVIWPAARGHQLATVCTLAAVVLLLGRWRYRTIAALVVLAIGLFAKETTLFAMVAIPFFFWRDWNRYRAFLIGWLGLAIGFVLLNMAIKDNLHTDDASLIELLYKTPFILLRPLGVGDYVRFDAISLLVTVAAFAAVLWLVRKGPGLPAIAWVLVCSAPIVPLPKLSARYLYLPAAGYALLFCALCMAIVPLLKSASTVRIARLALIAGLVAIVATNGLLVQREIGDYELLADPYMELVENVRPGLEQIEAGETFVIVDAAPQTTIRNLTTTIQERGNITKLIPYRKYALDGLIQLPDLLNVARERTPGLLGRPVESADDATLRWFAYDGEQLRPIAPQQGVSPQLFHRAAWDQASEYYPR